MDESAILDFLALPAFRRDIDIHLSALSSRPRALRDLSVSQRSCCMPSSDPDINAMSSVNARALAMPTPSSSYPKRSPIISKSSSITRLNRIGDIGSPCFTSLFNTISGELLSAYDNAVYEFAY